MKKVNSSSWKRPFDGGTRTPDSAIGSQGMFSQGQEFSQVTTQDLFGQSSQNEVQQNSSQKSIYEKWLHKKNLTLSANNGLNMWTSKGSDVTNNSNMGVQYGYGSNRQRLDNDVLDLVQNHLHESRSEMKCLTVSLKDTLESLGGTLSNETKFVLSSFMEEFSKNYKVLSSNLQELQKSTSMEKEFEKQLASKNCQISSLETNLKVLEEEGKKRMEEKCNCNSDQLKEEVQSLKELMVKKLENIANVISNQKETTNEYAMKVINLKDDCAGIKKEVQKCVKESESRILRETKRLPQDLKNAVNIKSDVINLVEGIPAELEYSLKSSLELFAKDLKSELTKEQRKNYEQNLRKSFDHISNKMDSLLSNNKKIHQFVQAKIQEPFRSNFKDLEGSITYLKNKSSSDSSLITDLNQRMISCKQDQQQQLQTIINQQKELAKQFENLSNHANKTTRYNGQSVQIQTSPFFSNTSMELMETNSIINTQQNELVQKEFAGQGRNYQYPGLAHGISPNNFIHKVDNKVNNISMPVINQTNIYPSQVQDSRFKQAYSCLLNDRNYIQTNQSPMISETGSYQNDMNKDKLESPFIRKSVMNYHPKPSPIAAVKPQQRICHNSFDLKTNVMSQKEKQFIKPLPYKSNNRCRKNVNHGNQLKPYEESIYAENKINNMRNKNGQSCCKNKVCAEETPHRIYNLRDIPGSALRRINARRKREFPFKEEQGSGHKSKPNASIYDFIDDKTHDESVKENKQADNTEFENQSTASSPALTLNLAWNKPLFVIRRNQSIGGGNSKPSRFSQAERQESLILDNML